jgi:hypothetical protein
MGLWGTVLPSICIIRLQAVVEIITNDTERALNLLAKQSTKMRLTLDYLLASEAGVCGKFNLSNCCLQTDDEGKVTEEITDRIRKIIHVPSRLGKVGTLRIIWRMVFNFWGIQNPS